MSIKAFGKEISKEEAIKIIIDDKIAEICHSNNTDQLVDILTKGCEPLEKWSDRELQNHIENIEA